jgi:cadmium resistance protein CadD (predicted permease)
VESHFHNIYLNWFWSEDGIHGAGMEPLIGSVQAAIAVAVATTFDDNIYLTCFFSETDRHFRPAHVIAGELLSLTLLIGISFVASRLMASVVPVHFIGWLGLLPILIGLSNLADLLRQLPSTKPSSGRKLTSQDQQPLQQHGFVSRRLDLISILRNRQTYVVAAVGFSNGGNNLTIYIPLLANSTLPSALIAVLTCYGAVICWLSLSFRLTRLPGVALVLARYAKTLFPFVLMWLGFRILNDSGVLRLPLF